MAGSNPAFSANFASVPIRNNPRNPVNKSITRLFLSVVFRNNPQEAAEKVW